jgi:hypothetical protein
VLSQFNSSALDIILAITFLCPKCTPSKVPIVTTVFLFGNSEMEL